MTSFVTWLVALEIISVAFLPLSVWALRSLPDRGYIFARILGLLLITYVTWIVGTALPIAGGIALPAAVLLAFAAWGWWRRRDETIAALQGARTTVVIEEALFMAALAAWALLRVNALGSAINHTEQFMDMAFLNASYHSASYPPYDPWMSGFSINYYYLGYLAFATLGKLAFVAPAVAFNLANATIFALVVAACYSLGYALTRHVAWASVAPLFVALLGNWHAALWQVEHGGPCGSTSTFWGSFWQSTRVIGNGYTLGNWAGGPPGSTAAGCPLPNPTITEYPLFSFVLGDLHPHVMALPFVLLALALGSALLFRGPRLAYPRDLGLVVLAAVSVGALFAINSWDFPTYLLVVVGCVAVHGYLTDDSPRWWRAPLLTALLLALLSVAAYSPFYLQLHGLTHGVGRVTTPTDLFEFVQVLGLFAIACGLLLVSLALLLQPAAEGETEEVAPELVAERGAVSEGAVMLIAGAAILLVGIFSHEIVLTVLLLAVAAALLLLHRVLNTETPNRSDAAALVLLAVGALVVAVPELIYLRDAFDGGALYRMNTVFKFYYQGWILLGVAASYGAFRSWQILRSLFAPATGWIALGIVALGTMAAALYTVWVPSATVPTDSVPRTLDGSAWIAQSSPGDYAGLEWLQSHVSGHPTIVEAVGAPPNNAGGDYSNAAEFSTFTGLPTVMGWTGHEGQWGRDPSLVSRRAADVATIYKTTSTAAAEQLLHGYGVTYVIVGSNEQAMYGASGGLQKFRRFMRVAFAAPGITIYTW